MFSDRNLPHTPDRTAKKEDGPQAGDKELLPRSRRSLIRLGLAFFGVASLNYLLGAAAVYFDLPSSSFLRRAFSGGVTWYEWKADNPPNAHTIPPTVGQIDKPDKTCDGFTLCMYGGGTRAVLLNMRGQVVHQWHVPFHEIWSAPPHLRGAIKDASVYFNDGHLYPNGDLLAVIEGPSNMWNPSEGYGLVKLDKDSHVLWKYAEKCHHDLDVAEDGTVYALVNEMIDQVPQGMEYLPTPCMVDVVDAISPEGKRLKRLSLLKAFHDSPFAPLLSTLEKARRSGGEPFFGARLPEFREDERRRDVLHLNAIKVLSRALAPKFPQFKAGQLLLSPRRLDALAVLDPNSGKIVWAARGPWLAQHDPSFLDNGHLLLFDNLGSPSGSRVLEYDLNTQAFPWSYPGERGTPFFSKIRGLCQRLPNGNTLITSSERGEVFEVTPSCEVVWSCSVGGEFYRARRYMPDQLPFLKDGPRARP